MNWIDTVTTNFNRITLSAYFDKCKKVFFSSRLLVLNTQHFIRPLETLCTICRSTFYVAFRSLWISFIKKTEKKGSEFCGYISSVLIYFTGKNKKVANKNNIQNENELCEYLCRIKFCCKYHETHKYTNNNYIVFRYFIKRLKCFLQYERAYHK